MMRACSVLISTLYGITVHASQTADVVSDLNFGTIAVIDNSSRGELRIDYLGNMSSTYQMRWIELGQPGSVRLTGFAQHQQIFISAFTPSGGAASDVISNETFTLTNLSYPSYIYTDRTGQAEFRFGATLQNSGSGLNQYADTQFRATIHFTFNY